MSLTAYSKSCGSVSGGLNKIYFAVADDVTSFTLGSGVQSYDTCTMVSGKVFVTYDFLLDSAELKFSRKYENGSWSAIASLEFALDGLSTDERNAVNDLITNADCGIIAIVEDNTSTDWVLGYSEKHAKARAKLKSLTGEATTGKALTDANQDVIVMTWEQAENFREYTGTVPV